MAKYKVISGIMEGLEFNGSPVKIGGELRIWNDDSMGQSFTADNCIMVDSGWTKITWSPYSTNILDASKYNLTTPEGQKVYFYQSMRGFELIVNDEKHFSDDNIEMSYLFNYYQIGGRLKSQN